jgi:hypothetical protein
MTTTPPVAPDRDSVPFSNPDTPLHSPPASADTFSLGTPSPDIHDAKFGTDTDTDMTADDTPDTDMTKTTLIPATNASPSAPNWADTVDDDDADDDASTVLADPDVPLKITLFKHSFASPDSRHLLTSIFSKTLPPR